ncbi:MAG: GFA family protein [Gammaproteobacteria bacterium]|nr:GFA family protein [Gammaproteobacteria bacterium]
MEGQCLCGAVGLSSPEAREIGACHCGFCRKWGGGGPLLAVHCGPDVELRGTEHMTVYASSEWAERAFCMKCGTHLYYKLLATGEYFVPAGVFDSSDFELATQIYVDKKPPYYALANQTPMLTEQQVIDQFAASGDTPPESAS